MNEVANAMLGSDPLTSGAGSTLNELFVINLCASMTPMPSVPKSLKGFEAYKLYQLSRVEDGRRRFRLRLGFFTSETAAELLLSSVRSLYPAAFAGCATPEDLRFASETHTNARLLGVAASQQSTALPGVTTDSTAAMTLTNFPVTPVTPLVVASALQKTKAASPLSGAAPSPESTPATVGAQPQVTSARQVDGADDAPTRIMKTPAHSRDGKLDRKAVKSDELNLEFMPTGEPGVPTAATHSAAEVRTLENKPFHVARGITLPEINLDFAPESIDKSIDKQASATPQVDALKRAGSSISQPLGASGANTSTTALSSSAQAVRQPAPVAHFTPPAAHIAARATQATTKPAVTAHDDYVPILDTTLTIRTLTQTEVEDPNQPKWFVVQLTTSDRPFDLDAMPRLDIFSAYRLYSVVVTEGGTIRHTLRLGFFRENVSAEAVSGYLKTFFPTPTITRIGIAEYNRFAEPKPRPITDTTVPADTAKRSEQIEATPAVTTQKIGVATTATVKPMAAASHGATRVNGKTTQAVASKSAKATASTGGIRPAQAARPQSFLSRLIGRDLD